MIIIIGGTACILLCFEESIEEKETKILAQLSKAKRNSIIAAQNLAGLKGREEQKMTKQRDRLNMEGCNTKEDHVGNLYEDEKIITDFKTGRAEERNLKLGDAGFILKTPSEDGNLFIEQLISDR